MKGAISGALGGYGTGKLIGGIGSLGGAGAGAGAGGTGATGGGFFSKVGEFILPGQDKVGLIGNIGKGIGSLFGVGGQDPSAILMERASADPALAEQIAKLSEAGLSPDQILNAVGGGRSGGNVLTSLISGGGADNRGNFGLVGDILGGGIGGGQGGGMSPLVSGGIAALLGKLAFDEAKNRRGVPRTPLTTMDAMGRFNIEQEIAKRMGKGNVDPREFGLMSRDTIPMLSGGRKRPERAVTGEPMRYGGPVMAYAEGGGVEMEEFKAMDGKINGPGTETSDDIPAMLSDGEFVMKAQAVRGAGAFDLSKGDGGIITLKPNGKESRERGTQIMYQMMDMFSNQARAS